MSFYFREKPRFGDRMRGKSKDELLQELKQQFDDDSKSFFEPTTRNARDPFERHAGFTRGFPFDDDTGFGRRTDIRSHLDDLASRHPEFADHLLGPPWGDIPFHGTLRNRRRGSGTGSYQGHPDEDARSQASGSSAASAASGASGVSSHGDPEVQHSTRQPEETAQPDTRRNPIPQYGLRNTVDIGQHRHNMENPDKALRGQRSMSAPPENRQPNYQQQYAPQYAQPQFQQPPQFQSPQQQQFQQPQQQQTPQNQRFVSRVDITPQQQTEAGGKPPMSPKIQQPQQPQQQQPQQQPQQQQQKSGQQGNVRHIPIFVEGRDEPVIPRNVEEPAFPRQQQSPPQFQRQQQSPPTFQQTPPQFHRPSHFNQHFGNKQSPWPPQFQDHFYQQQAPFEQPRWSHSQQQPPQQQQSPNHYQQQQQQYRQQQAEKQRAQQQPEQQPEQPEPVKQKPVLPKEPLEKVALVQKEVDSLAEQVKVYTGNSRQDKHYMFLDEMLTRELIKLDDIETEGKDNVRQARKVAIKTIQDCISLLESKVPLPGQQKSEEQSQMSEENATSESMEIEQEAKTVEDNGKAIPLPPAPSSPTKDTSNPEDKTANQEQQNVTTHQTVDQSENTEQTSAKSSEVTEIAPVAKDSSETPMEIHQEPVAPKELAPAPETEEICKTDVDAKIEKKEKKDDDKQTEKAETTAQSTEKSAKSPKTPKKIKKTKKQTPVSEEAIPLPPPEANQPTSK